MWCRSKKAAAVILLVIVFALVSSLTWLNEPTDPSALASDSSDSPSILWKYNLASTVGARTVLLDGVLYMCPDFTSEVHAINATTGSLIWRFDATGQLMQPYLLGETVYLCSYDEPYLRAVDASSGILKWTYQSSRPYGYRGNITLANGVLYAENSPYLEALDPDSGAMIWRYAVPYLGPLDSTSVYGFGGYSGQPSYIRALDLTTGALKWSHQENAQMGMPILYEDLLLYYCQDGYISALGKSDGTEKWRCAGECIGGLTIANDTLYCKRDKAVVAIDPLTGTTRWSQDVGDYIRIAEISNGTLYVTGGLGFYALDAATGRLEWSAEHGTLGAIVGDIVLVYVRWGSDEGEAVLALDRHTGTEQWRLGMQPYSPNRIPGEWGDAEGYNQYVHVCQSGPIVYLSSPTNPLYAIQIDSGVVDWTFEAGGGIPYAPVVGDGVLYVSGYDGYLYALDITSAALAIPEPSDLLQLKADGLTAIDVDGETGESTVVFKATVSDPEGDQVKLQIELRRLDEYGGAFDETQGGLKDSDLVNSGSQAVVRVDGLQDAEYHWRARAIDSLGNLSPWVEFGGNPVSERDFAVCAQLGETISRRITQQVTYPLYLMDPDSFKAAISTVWLEFTSWGTQTGLVEKYDEFYFTGIDYDCLRFNALLEARNALNDGDIARAEELLQRATSYERISNLSFEGAADVFANTLDAAEIVAQTMRTECEVVRRGLLIPLKIVNPTAAKVADYIFIATDYAIDSALGNQDQATRDAIVKIAVNVFFDEVKLDGYDGKTLSEWVKTNTGYVVFPELAKHFNLAALEILSPAIKEVAASVTEDALQKADAYFVEKAEELADTLVATLQSPGELSVYDSAGQVTGLANAAVSHGVPHSFYYSGMVTIFYPQDSYVHQVVGTDKGTYGLDVTRVRGSTTSTFVATDIPTSGGAVHQYIIDWDALARGEKGVTVKIDSNGDGVYERTGTADAELTPAEFKNIGEKEVPSWIWIVVGVGAAALVAIGILIWRRVVKKPVATG